MADRYLKTILTVIALELLWIGVKDLGTPVGAQANGPLQQTVQPVVIRGIELKDPARNAMPIYTARPLIVDVERPIPIVGAAPLKVEADKPLKIQADAPLPIQSVPYTPGRAPGE